MKRFLSIILLIVCTVIITGGITWIILHKNHTKKITALNKQKNRELGISKCFVIKQYRLECMIRTLEVAYKLSKWESYYLCLIFDDFSTMYKVPWEIFPAIIRVESNFNPSAKSPADCYGFMQVKKSTGREVAEKLGIQFNDKTLWNDIVNVILGSTYLCTHIDKKGLKDGIRTYLGGPDYKKSIKSNHDIRKYVREYKTSVVLEYEKLALMFRGVVDELSYDYKDIYITPQETDPTPLIFTLFIDSVNIQK
jgi:hypothetical protein